MRTSAAACCACSSVSATTSATGCPWWFTRSSCSTCRRSPTAGSVKPLCGLYGRRGAFRWVTTATTPGARGRRRPGGGGCGGRWAGRVAPGGSELGGGGLGVGWGGGGGGGGGGAWAERGARGPPRPGGGWVRGGGGWGEEPRLPAGFGG